MSHQLRRPATRAPRPASRAARARHLLGRIEQLETRMALSASFGSLPLDGAGLAIQGERPEPPAYTSGTRLSVEVSAAAHPELQSTSPVRSEAAANLQAGSHAEETFATVKPLAVWNISVPLVYQPMVEQELHVVIVAVQDPSSWGMSGPVTLVFPATARPAPASGSAPTETTRPASSPPPGALGVKSAVGKSEADEPAAPKSSTDTRSLISEPAARAYAGPPAPLVANPALVLADAAWYSLLATPSTPAASSVSFSPWEASRAAVASLSAYDAAFEAYSLQPLALVWNIADESVPHTMPSTPADSNDQGGFVTLDGSELSDSLLLPDVANAQNEAVDAVLAALDDAQGPAVERAADATWTGDVGATAGTPQTAEPVAGSSSARAEGALADKPPVAPAKDLACSGDEGGMILLQLDTSSHLWRPSGADGSSDYSLAAVYMVNPDKLLEASVEMDASIGVYQALDVATGDLRQADGKPVKAAEPVGTRKDHADEKVSAGDARPDTSRRAAAWLGTLIVAGSTLGGVRPDADQRDRVRCRRLLESPLPLGEG